MPSQPNGVPDHDEVHAYAQTLLSQAYNGILPECSRGGLCQDCPVLNTLGCPIAADTDFMALLEYYSSRFEAVAELRERRIDLVAEILRRHKLAMHWELIAKIAMEENPAVFTSQRSVLGILAQNPQLFRDESFGSYSLASTRIT